MATRYIGDAKITITYRDRGDYAGTACVPVGRSHKEKRCWRFDGLRAPAVGFGPGIAYDSPEAYDEMAESAVSFGSYYTTHNRGDDVPDWAPAPEVADAISDATSLAMYGGGGSRVRRSKEGAVVKRRSSNPATNWQRFSNPFVFDVDKATVTTVDFEGVRVRSEED